MIVIAEQKSKKPLGLLSNKNGLCKLLYFRAQNLSLSETVQISTCHIKCRNYWQNIIVELPQPRSHPQRKLE